MAFGYQFYAYSLYFHHSQIDPTWSFGQIVAIMVWIPAIAEYIYLLRCETFAFLPSSPLTNGIKDGIREGNEYRLRAPLTITSRQPTPATNENSVQPHQHPENASHTSLSEHSHSGSQGNESAMLPTTWSKLQRRDRDELPRKRYPKGRASLRTADATEPQSNLSLSYYLNGEPPMCRKRTLRADGRRR